MEKYLSVRFNDEEFRLLQAYVKLNNLNLSQFVHQAIIEKIEDTLDLDEEYILNACEKASSTPCKKCGIC